MREGEPSRTALGAAMLRALHQDRPEPRIFTDPLAWAIVGGRDAALAEAAPWQGSRLQVFIAVRHRFAEDALAAAVARGTRQVVVLGAGLDTFAYRNPWPDVAVFEVDFPATGSWKRERLLAAGITTPAPVSYVGVDFERESFLTRLVEAGFEAGSPAYFLWLGVVPYLSRDAVTDTLRTIAALPGAEVVLDHTSVDAALGGRARSDRRALVARVAAAGEPLTDGWAEGEMPHLLESLGFGEIEDLDRSEIRTRYLGLPPVAGASGGHVVRARVVD